MVGTLILVLIALASPSGGDVGDGPLIGNRGDGDAYYIDAYQNNGGDSADPVSASSNNGPPRQYVRGPLCQTELTRSDLGPQCPNNDPIVNICLDGTQARDPLWSRTQQADGTWTQWAIVQDYFCPGDAPLLAAIDREWTAMKPQPSDIALQPNTGWVIATVPTVAMAADAPRLHSAVLLGANVDIRATAQDYRWEWGDGTHTATSDPGKPYPNATLTHTYPHASDAATVALTTTWTGEYRVNGGPWLNFDSTINSTSTPIQLAIYDPRSRLVNCDLDGKCRIEARG